VGCQRTHQRLEYGDWSPLSMLREATDVLPYRKRRQVGALQTLRALRYGVATGCRERSSQFAQKLSEKFSGQRAAATVNAASRLAPLRQYLRSRSYRFSGNSRALTIGGGIG